MPIKKIILICILIIIITTSIKTYIVLFSPSCSYYANNIVRYNGVVSIISEDNHTCYLSVIKCNREGTIVNSCVFPLEEMTCGQTANVCNDVVKCKCN